MVERESEFRFPACWDDDVRMAVLFAQPRNENLNPHDWSGKYKFWRELIIDWATKSRKLVISIDDLKRAFCRKGKLPASLERVLDEMLRQGDLTTVDQCLAETANSSWTSWGVGLVKSSVVWSWNRLKSSIMEVERVIPHYVFPAVLKERGDEVMRLPIASSEETFDLDELAGMRPDLFSNAEEANLVLNHLQNLGHVALDTSASPLMVKFKGTREQKAQSSPSLWRVASAVSPVREKKPSEITEADRTLATLKRTEKLLSEEIEKLEQDMEKLEQTARTKLKEGSRSAAKAALYRRKQLQQVHDKRSQALMNIQTMKLQLSQAKTDSKIMEAYQMGLAALKNSFSDLSLNEDHVQDTLIELEGVLEQHRDIEDMLATSIPVAGETESDLEEELKQILTSADESTNASEPEFHWPSVPVDSPRAVPVQRGPVAPLPAT